MEYNTSKKQLILPEYGRNIQKLVEYCKTIKDREERNKMAQSIIEIMGNMYPHFRDIADFKHKLWDHLQIMSGYDLDIDSPYEDPPKETLRSEPAPVPYNNKEIKYKHYGKVIEKLIEKATEFEEGEEKNALFETIGNQMKKNYITWNKDTVSDEQIFQDMEKLSGGKIKVDREKVKLTDAKEIVSKLKKKKNLKKAKNSNNNNHQKSH